MSMEKVIEAAAEHHGGRDAVMEKLPPKADLDTLRSLTDDRVLATMTRYVFNSGFNWKVIDQKWTGFEEAFEQFDPSRWRFMDDDDVARLKTDTRIVRHEAKIRSVATNAALVRDMADNAGSAGDFLADWPDSDYVGLVRHLHKNGNRLGGHTGQYVLRALGKPSFILSNDVVKALIREGIVEREPKSQRDLAATQQAFNTWQCETGFDLTQLSRLLALSVGPH